MTFGFLAGGDSQGDGEFTGESNLGERLGIQFIEFEKPAAFCLGSSLWDIFLTLCLPGDPSVVCPPLELGSRSQVQGVGWVAASPHGLSQVS